MNLSCTLSPGPKVVEEAELAESLGYSRIWINDSPSLYPEVWMVLSRIAERTSRIGIGPGLLVPSLRSVMTNAAAIATLELAAPGRTAAVFGTGFTGRALLGQNPMRWADVADYVTQLRVLLSGGDAEFEGAVIRMVHPEGYVADRPVKTPILIGANGPKGLDVAKRLGDGVLSVGRPVRGFDWSAVVITGTVLDDGEEIGARALAAAGPGTVVKYHYLASVDRAAAAALPLGEEWLDRVEQIPSDVRHLALHSDHYVEPSELDRLLVTPESVTAATFTASAPELRTRLEVLFDDGASEVSFHPAGPDIPRELRAFAAMADLSPPADLPSHGPK